MMAWRPFLARVGVATLVGGFTLTLAVFVGMRLATADPGGPTRPELTYAGVLRDADGGLPTTARTTTLTFMFAKSGVPLCTISVPGVVIAAGGAFTASIPIASCGSGYFDGSDITYTVTTPGEPMPLAADVHVTPVPYARFADQAGPEASGNGTFTPPALGTMTNIPLLRSSLFPSGYRLPANRALFLTVRASGDGAEHTALWLLITGSQSGTVVQHLATHRYVGLGSVDVVSSRDPGTFVTDDSGQGVTLRFVNFPTTRVVTWSYTVHPVDGPPR